MVSCATFTKSQKSTNASPNWAVIAVLGGKGGEPAVKITPPNVSS